MMKYRWIDENTGELRRNLFDIIISGLQDRIWCLKNGHKMWRRKWHYNREGW